MGRLAGPRHIGDVDHSVDALLQFHKGAVGCGVSDDSLHRATHGIPQVDLFPRIGFEVTHGEREFLLLFADANHDGVDLLAVLQDIAGSVDSACPRELGDVNETFHSGFELDEGAVGNEAGDFSADLEIDWVFLGNLVPWVFRHLFHA